MSSQTNPVEEEDSPTKYEEAYFNDEAAYALYDAYLMLRDAGYSVDELEPLTRVIETATVYDADAPEWLFTEYIEE